MSTEAGSDEGAPRHARVVPAFVVATIRRPLEGWNGEIRPAELLRWERKGDLSESLRRELRQTIVKRTRVRAERLWSQPTGVRLVDGWQTQLTGKDRQRVLSLELTKDKPLESWTLRELKEALRLPLEQTLDILARLEALYWQPPLPSARPPAQPLATAGPPCEVDADLRQLALAVLELPWLSKVTAHDLRFGYDAPEPLPEWIRAKMRSGWVPASFRDLLVKLLEADKLTASAEAHALALSAARECAPRQGGAESAARWVSMLMQRHISRSGAGRTLAEVGSLFDVTRERIRQVCDAFEEVFAGAQAVTPALDRVLQAAARVAPMQVNELDEQLRRFIGEDAGIESLVCWAKVLGHKSTPVTCERVRTRTRGQLIEVTMVQAPDAPPWVQALIRHVSRDSSMFGCTNVLRVAGRLALKEGLAPGQEAIEAALEAAKGFRWLDKETGWFTLGDSSNCSAASRVRKIIAVAQETVGTDEIASALASDDIWMYRESTSLGLATPPVHVLRELMLAWPWLRVVQKSRFVAGPDFKADGVLSEVEQRAAEVISAHDGIACRFELKDIVTGELGMTDVLLAAVLGSSPIFERVEHGLYRLRGRRVGDEAVADARRRLRERAGHAPIDKQMDGFTVRVTEASLRNEQYHVPAVFHAKLAGKRHTVLTPEGVLLGEARVGAAGALAGLNRLFPQVKPGDQYQVAVQPGGLRVVLLPASAQNSAQELREASERERAALATDGDADEEPSLSDAEQLCAAGFWLMPSAPEEDNPTELTPGGVEE